MRPRPISPQTRFSLPLARRMLGYGFLLLLSLGSVVAAVLWHDRDVRYRHGQEQVSATAIGLERELRRELEYLERGLAGLATDALQFSRSMPERSPYLLALRIDGIHRRNPHLRDVALGTTLPDYPGLHAIGSSPAGSTGRLRVGHPRKVGGVGWVLPLALPIPNAAAGEPAWVVASLRINALEEIAADLDLGSEGIANIMHRDGWMVVRSRDHARWVGAPLQHTDLFRRRLPRAHNDVFDLASPLDGTTRISAYRVLPEYPLVVVAGIARRDALRGWGAVAMVAVVLGGLLTLLWGALLRVQMRSRWEQRQLLDSLQHSTEQLEEARRIAGLGDWTWEVDTGRVTWSEEIYQIYGLSPQDEPLQIEEIFGTYIVPADRERLQGYIAKMLADGGPMEAQFRIQRADGAVRSIYARGEWVDPTPGRRVMRGVQQDISALAEVRERRELAQEIARVG
ncbi:MAG: PAS domain-containing protein, partial [Lysobacter sp.]